MKYIRTKDGVYEVAVEITITEFQVIDHLHNRAFLKSEIISQADTIEELCDMTIVVDDERPSDIFELEFGIDKELINKYKDIEGVIVYGAIWTSKGLIYVAKMNEKGELELI